MATSSGTRNVNQAEGGRGEHQLLLAPLRRSSDQERRVPLAIGDSIAFGAEPLMQKLQLSGFTGTVDPFYHEELARKGVFALAFHILGPKQKLVVQPARVTAV